MSGRSLHPVDARGRHHRRPHQHPGLAWFDTDQIDINKAAKTIGKAVDSLVKRFINETRENS